MSWRSAAAAALLCALLFTGCGASEPRQPGGMAITVATERDGVVERRTLPPAEPDAAAPVTYVLNRASVKFHRPECAWAAKISGENRIDWTGDRETLLEVGYRPCSVCKP